MNRLYCLTFKAINKIIDKLNNSHLDINLKDIIDFYYKKNIDISMNEDTLVRFTEDSIKMYIINKSSDNLLAINLNDIDDFEETELYLDMIKTNFPNTSNEEIKEESNRMVALVKLILDFLYRFMENSDDFIKRKEYKIIKGKYFEQIKFKNLNLDIKIYPENSDDFDVYDYGDKVSIIANNTLKIEKTIPSRLYPLPNNSKYKIFNAKNTENFDDDTVNKLLSGIIFKPGYCYTNSQDIVDILRKSISDKAIDYYSGWLFRGIKMTHHAWVIVDNKYLIDVSIYKQYEKLKEFSNNYENGKISIGRKETIDILTSAVKSDEEFKEKFYYGKAPKEYIYVGVKSNPEEARKSYNDLITKTPNHPDYQNIYSDGSNATLNEVYKRL